METRKRALGRGLEDLFNSENLDLESVEQKIYELDENEKQAEIIKSLTLNINNETYKEELKERLDNLVISQTSLNKYINCPLQYFYSDILITFHFYIKRGCYGILYKSMFWKKNRCKKGADNFCN